MFDRISLLLIFFGGFMSWTMAVGMVFEDTKWTHHYVFGALMFCLGSLQLLNGLLITNRLGEYTALIFLHLPLIAWVGPLFFFSFKSAYDDSYRIDLAGSLHLVPGIAAAVLIIPLVIMDPPAKLDFVMSTPDISSSNMLFRLYSGLFITGIVSIICYIIYFFRQSSFMLDVRLIRKKQISPYLVIITVTMFPLMIICFGSILAIGFAGYTPMSYIKLLQVLTAFSFVYPMVFFIMEKKRINFFRLLNSQIRQRRYEVAILKNLDVLHVIAKLHSLMDEEKIYCDENLSVESLAETLSVKPYQLSRIINENLGGNFNYYVNRYRVEESKKLFLADARRTIISVAYAVGFNSTTVFNDWFKRITGISPKAFRSSIRE